MEMTTAALAASAQSDSQPPAGLSDELQSLWHLKADHWGASHNIAQEIHTPMGSWIHALLHLVEGDIGNAGYWFRKANKPIRSADEVDDLWHEITDVLLE